MQRGRGLEEGGRWGPDVLVEVPRSEGTFRLIRPDGFGEVRGVEDGAEVAGFVNRRNGSPIKSMFDDRIGVRDYCRRQGAARSAVNDTDWGDRELRLELTHVVELF